MILKIRRSGLPAAHAQDEQFWNFLERKFLPGLVDQGRLDQIRHIFEVGHGWFMIRTMLQSNPGPRSQDWSRTVNFASGQIKDTLKNMSYCWSVQTLFVTVGRVDLKVHSVSRQHRKCVSLLSVSTTNGVVEMASFGITKYCRSFPRLHRLGEFDFTAEARNTALSNLIIGALHQDENQKSLSSRVYSQIVSSAATR